MDVEYTFKLRIPTDEVSKNLAIHAAGAAWASTEKQLSTIASGIEMMNVRAVESATAPTPAENETAA